MVCCARRERRRKISAVLPVYGDYSARLVWERRATGGIAGCDNISLRDGRKSWVALNIDDAQNYRGSLMRYLMNLLRSAEESAREGLFNGNVLSLCCKLF